MRCFLKTLLNSNIVITGISTKMSVFATFKSFSQFLVFVVYHFASLDVVLVLIVPDLGYCLPFILLISFCGNQADL